ncbi:hypothetical protein F4805DRAFT_457339 [Annulohypoxylon moriforme]|nr:hypothetical protein F4805DRAFT_457339 [Annulohypoxylon moriforme]
MPGDLNQAVYLKGLPDGLDFTVTAITPSIPDDSGWSAGYTHVDHGSITVNEKGTWDYLHLPFKLLPSDRDGLLGHFKLRANSGLWCTGPGGKVDVTFTIKGTTTVAGKSYTIPEKTGYISVSSSDWCGTARPDISNVTYSVAGVAPVNLSVTVHPNIGLDPDDAYIVSGIDKEKNDFGLNATTHTDTLKTVLSYAIEGILWGNERLAGWSIFEIVF